MCEELEPSDVQHETVRVLMAGVRAAADRMKSRLPAGVDVNDVVSAGYLALTQALAYWQEDSGESLEVHALKRATAAMVATLRANDVQPNHETFDTIVSPPRHSAQPECRSEIATHAQRDVAIEEIGVRVA